MKELRPAVAEYEEVDGDFGEAASSVAVEEEEAVEVEVEGETFLVDFGRERNALILRDAALSYSSIRLAKSSSEVMDTNASKSNVGN